MDFVDSLQLSSTRQVTYLSNALHGAAYLIGGTMEAVQVPTRDLGHDVV